MMIIGKDHLANTKSQIVIQILFPTPIIVLAGH